MRMKLQQESFKSMQTLAFSASSRMKRVAKTRTSLVMRRTLELEQPGKTVKFQTLALQRAEPQGKLLEVGNQAP